MPKRSRKASTRSNKILFNYVHPYQQDDSLCSTIIYPMGVCFERIGAKHLDCSCMEEGMRNSLQSHSIPFRKMLSNMQHVAQGNTSSDLDDDSFVPSDEEQPQAKPDEHMLQLVKEANNLQFGDMIQFSEYRGIFLYVLSSDGNFVQSYDEYGYIIPMEFSFWAPRNYYHKFEQAFFIYPLKYVHLGLMNPEEQAYCEKIIAQVEKNPDFDDVWSGNTTIDLNIFPDGYLLIYDSLNGGGSLVAVDDFAGEYGHVKLFGKKMNTLQDDIKKRRENDWIVLNWVLGDRVSTDVLRHVMEYLRVSCVTTPKQR